MFSRKMSSRRTSRCKSYRLYMPLFSKEVRLLHLLSPTESSSSLQHLSQNIQCELVQANLDDFPDYEALSYTWGRSRADVQIEINGCNIRIQPNLAHALAALRGREIRVLWVDALCINQDDSKSEITK
jgi:hypothetical protein